MDYLSQIPLTMAVGKAALAVGTTTTWTLGTTIVYAIKGKAYSVTAGSNGATPTTDAVTGAAFVGVPPNYGCIFVWCMDGTSTTAVTAVKVVQGPLAALDTGGSFILAPQFPPIPDTLCPIGYSITKIGATYVTSTAWVLGVNNLAALTGATHTFVDVLTMPGRPQVS